MCSIFHYIGHMHALSYLVRPSILGEPRIVQRGTKSAFIIECLARYIWKRAGGQIWKEDHFHVTDAPDGHRP